MTDELHLRDIFEIENEKYLLATDSMKRITDIRLQEYFRNLPEFWAEGADYETMILKEGSLNFFGSGFNVGYYVERYDSKKKAKKRHKQLKKLIFKKKYKLYHTNKMDGLIGEFIFEETD